MSATPPNFPLHAGHPAPLPDDNKTRKIELILQQLDSLPTLPVVAMRLLSLTGTADSKIEEVVQLISADQSLTSKLLSLANSAGSGAGGPLSSSASAPAGASRAPVMTVQQAVVRLGFEVVRNLVLSVKVFEIFQRRSPEEDGPEEPTKFNRTDFWKHSLAVATLAELIAVRCKPKLNPFDAFVCGLLHDLGKVAFDTAIPKSFARVADAAALTRGDIADVERRIIGMDHSLAGKRLAEAWNLPQLISQVIWLHGAPPPKPSAPASSPYTDASIGKVSGLTNAAMIVLIGLADLIVRRQHIGFSGNYLFPFETSQYTQYLGLTEQDLDDVTQQLAESLEKRAQSIGLYDIESKQLYLESIANANSELGRVNQTLSQQNRKLALRSACFEIMTSFYQRIVPASTPGQLLRAIGEVAHPFFESGRLVLFSQDPDQKQTVVEEIPPGTRGSIVSVGEVLLFDPRNNIHDSFLMPMPVFGGDQRMSNAHSINTPGGEVGAALDAARNFTRPASPQLTWLVERVQSFIGANPCWFMPLLCGNEPVGGMLWISKENANTMIGVTDLILVSQSWGMTLRTAQIREQQTVLTESLAAANRELGSLQQELVRAKSLVSLGEMAAGAAHEMNNPLAVVCGRAQLLAAKIADPTMKQEATLIATQGDRLSQIITDMMEFAKPQAPKPALYSVETVVHDAVKAAVERAGPTHSATTQLTVAPGIPDGNGDARQIRNAITEVVLNALQAVRAADSTSSRTANTAAIQIEASFDPLDRQLIVQVIDHGIGMSEDVVRQAFSPFFSAKSAGRNRGMGLPKALRWIENHGGTIRLDSQLGSGTTAVVIVPLNAEVAAIAAAAIEEKPLVRVAAPVAARR